MPKIMFTEPLDRLAPLFKKWVRDAINELVPALIEVHSSNPQEDKPEYLSADDVSKLLGVSKPTLRKFTRNGTYKAYRVGKRKIRYKRSEIEKVLLERRVDHLIKKGLSHD